MEIAISNPKEGSTRQTSTGQFVPKRTVIRILLVDDFEPWRHSVRSILQGRAQLFDEVADGLEAVRRASELKPNLILLDIGLPSLNGIEAAERINQVAPGAKVIFLSMNNHVDIVKAALSNGASGYVLKRDAGAELLPAIKAVLEGKRYVSSGVANRSNSGRLLD